MQDGTITQTCLLCGGLFYCVLYMECPLRDVPYCKWFCYVLGENYKPKLGVVVVQKRISTRIFGKGSCGYDNPPPGTVLDHSVTRKGWLVQLHFVFVTLSYHMIIT